MRKLAAAFGLGLVAGFGAWYGGGWYLVRRADQKRQQEFAAAQERALRREREAQEAAMDAAQEQREAVERIVDRMVESPTTRVMLHLSGIAPAGVSEEEARRRLGALIARDGLSVHRLTPYQV